MWMNLLGRRSWTTDTPAPTDPKPTIFEIKDAYQVGSYVVAAIVYPNCTTFEGRKIVMMKDTTVEELRRKSVIDPHFLDDNKVVARFRPDESGMMLLDMLVKNITESTK